MLTATLICKKEAEEKQKKPVMEGFEEHIIDMLLEDQRMPAKQRRTAKKIFEHLQKLGYQGFCPDCPRIRP